MNAFSRLRRWSQGKRLYALACVAALPDILTALQMVDFSQALPPGVAYKVALGIVVLRIVVASTAGKVAEMRAKGRRRKPVAP